MNHYIAKGFSLIELIFVIASLVFLVILLAALPNAISLVTKTQHQSLAREVAVKKIEDIRMSGYADLVNGEIPVSDFRLSQLPQGSGNVSITDCDPTLCNSEEAVKQVAVTINWVDLGKRQQVSLTTMVSEGGLGR